MLEFIITLPFRNKDKEFSVEMFGTINPESRDFVVNYELNDINIVKMDTGDFITNLKSFPVKCTDSYIYVLYDCQYYSHTTRYYPHGIGTLKGRFGSLIRHDPNNKYNKLLLGFEGINEVFPLKEFDVSFIDTEKTAVIRQPVNHTDEICLDNGITAAVYSSIRGIPDASCVDIHITQEQFIQIKLENETDIENLMILLRKIKHYIEFLFLQEIRITSVKMYTSDNREDQIISDPLLLSSLNIKRIEKKVQCWSKEEFFLGLQSWLNHYDELRQVISLWERTIYNHTVSNEDLFIWRCQAYELLCQITGCLNDKAKEYLENGQSYPNIRQYLIATNELFGISNIDKSCFMDVKDVRDVLTHYNPNKSVSDRQKSNAYNIIHYYFVAAFAKVVGFKCYLPPMVVFSQ